MEKLKKYKWIIHWSAFGILASLFVFTAIFFEDKDWIGNVLQAIGTIAGIYLTIIIFLQSKDESDKQFRVHIEHLQKFNTTQIEALQNSTEKQIDALQSSTEKQLNTLQELNIKQIEALNVVTEKQITALQQLTEKQIEVLHKTTFDQISSFEQQIREVTNKLSDNSILLAEILARELEKSLDFYGGAIKQEEKKYSNLTNWKLLRTEAEREQQLNNQ
ncbi:MAG: hypothetical protein A2X08_02570 [Bacteroidetes bacterium GWA2_32_17]|nr:MAG: hypothetical protein A2X08_02570 [Bacteroidetes bacterium GWA2_32_17]